MNEEELLPLQQEVISLFVSVRFSYRPVDEMSNLSISEAEITV